MDRKTLLTIRTLIPYIAPIRYNNPQFPEAYCDIVTSQITQIHSIWIDGLPVSDVNGKVGTAYHFWLKHNNLNIDFTAHQFPQLAPYITEVDGFKVLFGSDAFLQSIGYRIENDPGAYMALFQASSEIQGGDHGDCRPVTHYCRN